MKLVTYALLLCLFLASVVGMFMNPLCETGPLNTLGEVEFWEISPSRYIMNDSIWSCTNVTHFLPIGHSDRVFRAGDFVASANISQKVSVADSGPAIDAYDCSEALRFSFKYTSGECNDFDPDSFNIAFDFYDGVNYLDSYSDGVEDCCDNWCIYSIQLLSPVSTRAIDVTFTAINKNHDWMNNAVMDYANFTYGVIYPNTNCCIVCDTSLPEKLECNGKYVGGFCDENVYVENLQLDPETVYFGELVEANWTVFNGPWKVEMSICKQGCGSPLQLDYAVNTTIKTSELGGPGNYTLFVCLEGYDTNALHCAEQYLHIVPNLYECFDVDSYDFGSSSELNFEISQLRQYYSYNGSGNCDRSFGEYQKWIEVTGLDVGGCYTFSAKCSEVPYDISIFSECSTSNSTICVQNEYTQILPYVEVDGSPSTSLFVLASTKVDFSQNSQKQALIVVSECSSGEDETCGSVSLDSFRHFERNISNEYSEDFRIGLTDFINPNILNCNGTSLGYYGFYLDVNESVDYHEISTKCSFRDYSAGILSSADSDRLLSTNIALFYTSSNGGLICADYASQVSAPIYSYSELNTTLDFDNTTVFITGEPGVLPYSVGHHRAYGHVTVNAALSGELPSCNGSESGTGTLFVDCDSGNDIGSCGSSITPCKTLKYASELNETYSLYNISVTGQCVNDSIVVRRQNAYITGYSTATFSNTTFVFDFSFDGTHFLERDVVLTNLKFSGEGNQISAFYADSVLINNVELSSNALTGRSFSLFYNVKQVNVSDSLLLGNEFWSPNLNNEELSDESFFFNVMNGSSSPWGGVISLVNVEQFHMDGCTVIGNEAWSMTSKSICGAICALSDIDEGISYTFRNTIFENNKAVGGIGGAIFTNFNNGFSKGSLDFTNCTFKNNTASGGGSIGILAGNGGIDLASIGFSDCRFTYNTANFGGAIFLKGDGHYMNGLSFCVDDCSFFQNSAISGSGGSILFELLSDTAADILTTNQFNISNSFFNASVAEDAGGALNMLVQTSCEGSAIQLTFESTDFEGCRAYYGGGIGISVYNKGTSDLITNSLLPELRLSNSRIAHGASAIGGFARYEVGGGDALAQAAVIEFLNNEFDGITAERKDAVLLYDLDLQQVIDILIRIEDNTFTDNALISFLETSGEIISLNALSDGLNTTTLNIQVINNKVLNCSGFLNYSIQRSVLPQIDYIGNTFTGNYGALFRSFILYVTANTTSLNVPRHTFVDNIFSSNLGGSTVEISILQSAIMNITFAQNTYTNNSNDGHGGCVSLYQGGAGIYDSSLINFHGNSFVNNSATMNGGVVYIEHHGRILNSQYVFEDNSFLLNYAEEGSGGALCISSLSQLNVNYTFSGNTFTSCSCGGSGGAVYLSIIDGLFGINVDIEMNLFLQNSAVSSGGAVSIKTETGEFVSSVNDKNMDTKALIRSIQNNFTSNGGSREGGSLYVDGNCNLYEEDSNFIDNEALYYQAAIIYCHGYVDMNIDGLEASSGTILGVSAEEHLNITFKSVYCPSGTVFSPAPEGNGFSEEELDTNFFEAECWSCLPGTYSYDASTLDFQAECTECGGALDCLGGNDVKIVANVYSEEVKDEKSRTALYLNQCPFDYCCQTIQCSALEPCSGNRAGRLCGGCLEGYSHSLRLYDGCKKISPDSGSSLFRGIAILFSTLLFHWIVIGLIFIVPLSSFAPIRSFFFLSQISGLVIRELEVVSEIFRFSLISALDLSDYSIFSDLTSMQKLYFGYLGPLFFVLSLPVAFVVFSIATFIVYAIARPLISKAVKMLNNAAKLADYEKNSESKEITLLNFKLVRYPVQMTEDPSGYALQLAKSIVLWSFSKFILEESEVEVSLKEASETAKEKETEESVKPKIGISLLLAFNDFLMRFWIRRLSSVIFFTLDLIFAQLMITTVRIITFKRLLSTDGYIFVLFYAGDHEFPNIAQIPAVLVLVVLLQFPVLYVLFGGITMFVRKTAIELNPFFAKYALSVFHFFQSCYKNEMLSGIHLGIRTAVILQLVFFEPGFTPYFVSACLILLWILVLQSIDSFKHGPSLLVDSISHSIVLLLIFIMMKEGSIMDLLLSDD